MKATTVILFLAVFVCVAQANVIVESGKVQDFFGDLVNQFWTFYATIVNFVNDKVYYYGNVVGVEVVCRAAAGIKFSAYDSETMVTMCREAAMEQVRINSSKDSQ